MSLYKVELSDNFYIIIGYKFKSKLGLKDEEEFNKVLGFIIKR